MAAPSIQPQEHSFTSSMALSAEHKTPKYQPPHDIENPEIEAIPTDSKSKMARKFIQSHPSIYAIPSTICFLMTIISYTKTPNFTSLVTAIGQSNTVLLFSSLSMLYFPLLHYLVKLRGVNKNTLRFKLTMATVIWAVTIAMFLAEMIIGDAVPVMFFFVGCVCNLFDFAGIGDFDRAIEFIILISASMLAWTCWGHTRDGWMVNGILYAYATLRMWINWDV